MSVTGRVAAQVSRSAALDMKDTPMTVRLPASFLGKSVGRYPVAPASERTLEGITFDSKGEMTRFAELKRRERAGMICDLTLQPEYRVSINGKHFCKTTLDFRYRDVETGDEIIEDFKSKGRGGSNHTASRLRKKAAELFHNITITIVTDARA